MRHRTLIAPLAIAFYFLAFSPLCVNAQEVTATNGIYTLKVTGGGADIGTYSIETGSNHPFPGQNIFYESPATTYLTVRSYTSGTDYVSSNSPASTFLVQSLDAMSPVVTPLGTTGFSTRWNVTGRDRLWVDQVTNIEGTLLTDSVVRVTTTVTNEGDEPAAIGLRYEWDWKIANSDDSSFKRHNPDDLAFSTVFFEETPPQFEFYEETNDSAAFSVCGSVNGPSFLDPAPTPPDRFNYSHWWDAVSAAWDFPITGMNDDSAAVYYWGDTAERAIQLGPGESFSATQYVTTCESFVPPPCVEVEPDDEQILCATDESGDFTYTFEFTNVSGDVIEHLFLLEDPDQPLPPGVSFQPNYFNFADQPICSEGPGCTSTDPSSPNSPSRELTVTVRGATPGQVLELLLTLHDRNIEECCSVQKTIELPDCSCAQLVDDRAFCSLGFHFAFRHYYNFTLQNLIPSGVDNILLTPSPGSDIQLTPNHFLGLGLSGTPYSDGSGQFGNSVRITGPDAQVGNEVCFRLSTHDESFRQCCSIEQCVRLQSCLFNFIDLTSIGTAYHEIHSDGIQIFGFGSSGDDGLRMDFEPARAFDFAWSSIETTPGESTVALSVAGTLDDSPIANVSTLHLEDQGDYLRVRPDSSIGRFQQAEILIAGKTVALVEIDEATGLQVASGTWPQGAEYFTSGINVIVIWPQIVEIQTAAGSLEGDAIRFLLSPRALPDALTEATLLAADLPSITLTQASAEPTQPGKGKEFATGRNRKLDP